MKCRSLVVFSITAAIFCCVALAASAQDVQKPKHPKGYYAVAPLKGVSSEAVQISSSTGTSIPLWNYSVVDGSTYSGTMVGRSPFFHGARTTNISTVIVPIIFKMPDGGVFDPTAIDTKCSPAGSADTLVQQSPIVSTTSFTVNGVNVGTAQYVDAFQRANFWTNVSVTGSRYHTTLSPVTVLAPIVENVPSGYGTTNDATVYGGCGSIGVLDAYWWDPAAFGVGGTDIVQGIISSLASQGVSPTALPIFLFYNVVMSEGTPNLLGSCCILGYHGAYNNPVQTYSPVEFDTTGIFLGTKNISIMAHEVGEWMDDPLGTNPTPAWGNIGQVSGCQTNLEDGDPLTGALFPAVKMSNGYSYNPQELAFFSWYYGQKPSLGAGGVYSDNGTFKGFAKACPPGGTN